MYCYEGGHVAGRVAPLRGLQIALECIEFCTYLLHGFVEALYLAPDELFRNGVVVHFERRAGEEVRMANGDAAADTQSMQRKTHAALAKVKHWRGP